MNPTEDRDAEDMISGPPQQPGWDEHGVYHPARLSPSQHYSSYPFDHSLQHSHTTTMYPSSSGSSLQPSTHHQDHSQIHSSWPASYSDPSIYGQRSQPRLDAGPSSLAHATTSEPSLSNSSSLRTTTRVGPRKTLTDEDRRDICLYHRQHPDKKQTEIGEVFGVERSTISKILRQKEKYLGAEGGPATRLATGTDQGLFAWAQERERAGTRLTSDMLKRQARIIANSRRVDSPAVAVLETNDWLDGFLQRNPGLVTIARSHSNTLAPQHQGLSMLSTAGSMDRMPSSLPAHYLPGIPAARLDVPESFTLPGHSTSFGTRETFSQPQSAASAYSSSSGYGYGGTFSDTRSTTLYAPHQIESPTSATWSASRNAGRNYILSSTNPDPAGSPPLLGRSPSTRQFDIPGSAIGTIPSQGASDTQQQYSSYRADYTAPGGMNDLASIPNNQHIPLVHRTWGESQLPFPQPMGNSRTQQSTNSSPASTVVSSISTSMSPGGSGGQRPVRRRYEDEERALSALTKMMNSEDAVPQGQEPIRDMTVGRLIERLQTVSRTRAGESSSQETEAASRSLRRAAQESDGSELKRTRMQ